MKTAFIYAGQGSQRVGMGQDFYEAYPSVRELYDSFDLSFDIKDISFNGPLEALSQTNVTQPCMVAFAAAVTTLLKQAGVMPDAVCGLSLGEYSALMAAQVLTPADAVQVAEKRGAIMTSAAAGIDSAMLAVLGADHALVQEAVAQAVAVGAVDICNMNCTGQIVIGGEAKAVHAAGEAARKLGAKRTIPLNVSGPFHTRFMRPAAAALQEVLDKVVLSEPMCEVFFNVTGGPLEPGQSVRDALVRQLYAPVLFESCIKSLESRGIDQVIEIGPGKVLAGFVKKTAPNLQTISIDTLEDFEKAIGR